MKNIEIKEKWNVTFRVILRKQQDKVVLQGS